MIKQIDHIGIAVKDLKEAMSIYGDILGLKFPRVISIISYNRRPKIRDSLT